MNRIFHGAIFLFSVRAFPDAPLQRRLTGTGGWVYTGRVKLGLQIRSDSTGSILPHGGRCPMIFGGKANGMKHKFSSVSNDTSAKRSHRGVGQAVAALVMALALTIGGAGTTILLASQPAGLTVAPVTVDWEESGSLKHNNTKKHPSEPAASSTAEEPAAAEDEAAEQEQPAASVSAPAASVTTAEPAASSAAAAPAAPSEPAAEPGPAAPETEPEEDDPMAGSAEEVDHENAAFPHFVQETEELAAEDPLRAPEETADDVS